MKKWLIVLLALLIPFSAAAEEQAQKILSQTEDLQLQRFLDENEAEINVSEMIAEAARGKVPQADEIGAFVSGKIKGPFHKVAASALGAIAPVLLLTLLGSVFPESTGGVGGARLILLLAMLAALVQIAAGAIQSAQKCMRLAADFSDAVSPLLSAVVVASGMNSGAALITPSAALAGNVIGGVFAKYGVTACRYALVLSSSSSLCASIDLSSAINAIKKGVNWCCGLSGALFAALVSAQSSVAAALDGAAIKTAKYTVDSFSSIIGSGVSDAWGAYLSGVSLAKNAVGVSGAAAMLAVGIKPLAEIFFSMLLLNLMAVFLKLTGERQAAQAAEQLAGVCQMALALSCGCVVIAVILVGATMLVGNGLLY